VLFDALVCRNIFVIGASGFMAKEVLRASGKSLEEAGKYLRADLCETHKRKFAVF
jgi:hypothetical protein